MIDDDQLAVTSEAHDIPQLCERINFEKTIDFVFFWCLLEAS